MLQLRAACSMPDADILDDKFKGALAREGIPFELEFVMRIHTINVGRPGPGHAGHGLHSHLRVMIQDRHWLAHEEPAATVP